MLNRTYSTIYFCVIALLTFLPSNNTFNIIRAVIVGGLFLLTNMGRTGSLSLGDRDSSRVVRLMFISPFLSAAVVLLVSRTLDTGLFIHELSRMVFNIMTILTVRRLTVSYKTCYRVAIAVLLVNFAIQFLQYSGNEAIYDFLRNNYVSGLDEGEWSHLELASDGSGRYGSIYINPNVYLIIPMLALSIIFYQDRKKSSILNYAFFIVTFLSCVLTGSRTAIIVMTVISAVYFLRFSRIRKSVLLIIVAVIAVALYLTGYADLDRAFDMSELGSFMTKFRLIFWYWQSANPIYWITGSLGAPVMGLDSEVGHIYAWYGVLGVIWYIRLLKFTVAMNKDKFVAVVSVLSFVLVGLTSSVFLNFPVFTFFAAFVFSNKTEEPEPIEHVA